MDYIYKGEVQIYQEQLDDFLQVAQKLQIAGLVSSNSNKDVKNEPIIQENKIEKESNKEINKQPILQSTQWMDYHSIVRHVANLSGLEILCKSIPP